MTNLRYSISDKDYCYDTLREVVAVVLKFVPLPIGTEFDLWEGTGQEVKASEMVEVLMCDMRDSATERYGDETGDWPYTSTSIFNQADLHLRVSKAVDDWANAHDLQPEFFKMVNAHKVKVRMTQYTDPDTFEFEVVSE